MEIHLCPCLKAAPQLLARGVFRVLDFVTQLFLNMPPNNTALTKTLETCLDSLGYKVENRDALRRRLGNVLEWYTSMRHLSTARIDGVISEARNLLRDPAPSRDDSSHPQTSSPPHTPSTPTPHKCDHEHHRHATPESDEYLFSEPEDRERPSDYLHVHCPACFGGKWEDPNLILAVLFCGDACFTQRRNKGRGRTDPPRHHPSTVFVEKDVTQKMEDFVENVRPSQPSASRKKKTTPAAQPGNQLKFDISDIHCR
ncbi:hypothetical protein C8R43DRAFT_883873 [Mycena crocata]|nr:hypothetical protein C8R43DRAFT_883873 [Mycena crocata]